MPLIMNQKALYHGYLKNNLVSSLSKIEFSDDDLIAIATKCQTYISRYFDLHENCEEIVINVEKSPIETEVRIFLHDRVMTGCEYLKIKRGNQDSMTGEVVKKLYVAVG